jgi:hypothetical protein
VFFFAGGGGGGVQSEKRSKNIEQTNPKKSLT